MGEPPAASRWGDRRLLHDVLASVCDTIQGNTTKPVDIQQVLVPLNL